MLVLRPTAVTRVVPRLLIAALMAARLLAGGLLVSDTSCGRATLT